ncbi:ABC-type polysaccharide/polyol phosphate export systems, permease component [Chthonomonas calidirosea]|uniref:ABC transporter permease n=1 Tax=Chthonomonas calidirosea TaxID=454171 RepID=UPI0006DD3C60|nr:ABC transporter permease [Chthonomonas calidirosea]CEK20359.1 ABC-type polysaccharide/polyol phosphate export systems, permease component [Chthonomonas calidirosea]
MSLESFPETAPRPLTTIQPPKGWQLIDWKELWRYRDLLLALAGKDIRLRYRQTILGVAWVIMIPLISAGIFTFVFGRVAKLPSDHVPYILFAFVGTMAWNLFNSIITNSITTLLGNANMISKIYFPRLILPLSTALGGLLDFSIGLCLLIVLLVSYHVSVHWTLLLFPCWLLLLLAMALGIGCISSAGAVTYRDVRQVMPVLLNILLYASPVAYGANAVHGKLHAVYMLNPLAVILQGFRWAVFGVSPPSLGSIIYAMVCSLAIFLVGAMVFRNAERGFADVI